MAKRRKLRNVLAGMGQGIQQASNTYLQMVLAREGKKEQEEQAKLLRRRQLTDKAREDVNTRITPEFVGANGPDAAAAMFEQLVAHLDPEDRDSVAQPNFQGMDKPAAARMEPARRRVADFDTPEKAPSRAELEGTMRANRVDPEFDFALNPSKLGFGIGEDVQFDSPELTQLLEEVEARSGALTKERERTTPREAFTNADTGVTEFMTEAEQGERGSVKTGLSTAERIAEAGGVATAQGQAQQDVTNDPTNQRNRARGAGMEASARRRAEIAAELAQMGITGQQQTAALSLSDDFEQRSQEYVAVRRAYQNIAKLATQDSAASDIALIFNFMKSQDPGSTVREGEQATAQNAAGIPARVRNLYNKAITGERLAPEQRADFARTSYKIYQLAEQDQQELVRTYIERARGLNVPPQLVVRTPAELPEPETGGSSALDLIRQRPGQDTPPRQPVGVR